MAEVQPLSSFAARLPLPGWLPCAVLFTALWSAPVVAQAPGADVPPVPVELSEVGPGTGAVEVRYRGQALYLLKSGIGANTALERARGVERRLDEVVRDALVAPSDIVARHGEQYSEILAKGKLLGVITEGDAKANGEQRRLVTEAIVLSLRRVVADTRAEFSPHRVRMAVAWACFATLAIVVALFLAARLVRVARRVVDRVQDRRIEALRIQGTEIVSAERLRAILLSVLDWAWVGVCVLAFVAWLESVLSVLPWTRPLAESVLAWAWAPIAALVAAIIGFLPNVFYLGTIALVTWVMALGLRFLAGQVARGRIHVPDFDPEWAEPTYRIARVLLVALAVVAAFPYLPGSQSPAFQGVSLLLGLIVSLSSSSAISNAIAGIIITYTNAFKNGDRVRIGDTTGDVVTKATFVTQLRTIKNEVVAIPNANVLSSSVQNYSRMAQRQGLILHTTVTIGYDAPWRTVHDLLVTAARRTEGLLENPAPFVLQVGLNDFFVSYQVNAYTRRPNEMVDILSALHANIQDAFNEAGVEIMSPHIFGLRDANAVTIPPAHRPAGYEAPSFRVAGQLPDGAPGRSEGLT
jgi:small-conductance mechanosensitive channel